MRILGWLAPTLCIGVAASIAFVQHRSLQEAQGSLQLAQAAVQEATAAKEQLDAAGDETRYAAAGMGPYEESAFLNDLRSRAAACQVEIRRWDSRFRSFGSETNDETKDPEEEKRQEKLKGITRISSDLTLAGSYSGVRKFLGGMVASPRLFTLSNVKWSRQDTGGTELLVTVSRYVEPAKASDAVVSLDPASAGTGVN